jgi:hypothetical protein
MGCRIQSVGQGWGLTCDLPLLARRSQDLSVRHTEVCLALTSRRATRSRRYSWSPSQRAPSTDRRRCVPRHPGGRESPIPARSCKTCLLRAHYPLANMLAGRLRRCCRHRRRSRPMSRLGSRSSPRYLSSCKGQCRRYSSSRVHTSRHCSSSRTKGTHSRSYTGWK